MDPTRRQDADGTPHLTYFDRDTQLSFVWDGHSPIIQVAHGGYGEPSSGAISVHDNPSLTSAPSLSDTLATFQSICDDFVDTWGDVFEPDNEGWEDVKPEE